MEETYSGGILDDNSGDEDENGVYGIIRDLIVEGKDARFVNKEGRYVVNWSRALDCFTDYKTKKNPQFKSKAVSRRKNSNVFRSALLNYYNKEGAKEYRDAKKVNENDEVVERQFQMPPRLFKSMFRDVGPTVTEDSDEDDQEDTSGLVSSEGDNKPKVSRITSTSDTGFDEFMDLSSPVPPEIIARGPLHVAAYNKALEEGETRVMRLPVMLIGQARNGKTSLKKSLKKQKFDEKEPSTDGIERDPSYFSVTKEIMSSEETNEEQDVESAVSFHNRVANFMVDEIKKGTSGPNLVYSNSSKLEDSDVKEDMLAKPQDNFGEATEEKIKTDKESNNKNRVNEVPEKAAVCYVKMINDTKREDKDNVYFCVWDFGGQSVYYTTHPIFLTGKAIYLLVYDLTKDPEGIAEHIEKQGVFRRKVDNECRKTNQDYLHFWLSSVSALEIQNMGHSESTSRGKLPKRLPPVILVCTHADIAGESAEEIAAQVYGSLEAKPYGEHLYKKYFVVDNTKSGSAEECEDVQELRDEWLEIAKHHPHMQSKIPIKWLQFEEALMGKKDHFISLDEARRIARDECGIKDVEQFKTSLNFLHDLRILIHFDDTPKLTDMVILDPQWLIDLFRKVITVKPYERKSDEPQYKELWKKLQNKGVLEEQLIQVAWGSFTDETKEILIVIMEKFGLLCPMPSVGEEKRYLVPSMLMSPPGDKTKELLLPATIPHVFIRFRRVSRQEYVQVPPGLFERLVVKFLAWCIEMQFTPLYEDMYQNFVRFPVGSKGYSVILCCNSSSVQVVLYEDPVSSSEKPDVADCDIVLDHLETVLQSLREECFWLKTIEWEFNVICPVCCEQRSGKYYCKGCKEEESLYFRSEAELQDEQGRICRKNTLTKEEIVPVEGFALWFRSLRKQERSSEHLCGASASGPPEVAVTMRKSENLPRKSEPLDEDQIPIDILLLTVEDCEFLGCLSFLNPCFRRFYGGDDLGCVYVGDTGEDQIKLKIAVMKCHRGSITPGGSSVSAMDAVEVLGPKAVFSVGFCGGLDLTKVKPGDVVISDKLITYSPSKVTRDGIKETGVKVPLKSRLSRLILNARDGWNAPLKNPKEQEQVKVYCGAFLSGPEVIEDSKQCIALRNRFPEALAVEMEGEGLYAAAHKREVEWIIIKGVSEYAGDSKSDKTSWREFASLVAASLTAHILSDATVFQNWPHYKSAKKRKLPSD